MSQIPEAPLRRAMATISAPLVPAKVPPVAQVSFITTYGTKQPVPTAASSLGRRTVSRRSSQAGAAGRCSRTSCRSTRVPVAASTCCPVAGQLSTCSPTIRVITSSSSPNAPKAVSAQPASSRARRTVSAPSAATAATATTAQSSAAGPGCGPRQKSGVPRTAQNSP
ncbi:hypothetical protein LN042_17165 [Kitasatospora sp. RB6PN24]|uniref:hypothetical protein n=1 Tax=Kitasatospora humi TaxID=2893891 RepID=UPI001E3F9513|nr:hypothetical protein [Kitasatospora humi]MCC9308794.1 hypothetical protein [Kitasatospora humi]